MPYLACSSDSTNGFCPYIDTSCSKFNTCRNCDHSGACYEVEIFPNATVAEYGTMTSGDVDAIKAEIFARGPVVASLNGKALHSDDFKEGTVYSNETASTKKSHAISIIGWGTTQNDDKEYWIIRNSWGEYWNEQGLGRIELGKNILGIESHVVWATPGSWTEVVLNYDDDENEHVRQVEARTKYYQDPSMDLSSIQRRLEASTKN